MHPVPQPTLYQQLESLPEGLTGEILNGQLHTQPRPSGLHVLVESALLGTLHPPYHRGNGGPGGWWILVEPEVHFVRDIEVAIPDIAGWRRERLPTLPEDHRFQVAPDWVCEILSPSTASKDREVKLPLYAHYGVAYAWLIDPRRRRLEAYGLENGEWRLLADAAEDATLTVAPFGEIKLVLGEIWR